MKTSSCKAKGRKAAMEVQELILRLFPELKEHDVHVTSSGASGEDIVLSPAARGMLPISIECKNVEAINIWKALEQCDDNAGNWQPVLFFRRNRTKLYAAMDAEQLVTLLRIAAMVEMLRHDLSEDNPQDA